VSPRKDPALRQAREIALRTGYKLPPGLASTLVRRIAAALREQHELGYQRGLMVNDAPKHEVAKP